jgi:hypothetical protein
MGIGIVLLMLAIVGVVAAGIAAAILAGVTALLTRRAGRERRRAILFAALLPFASLAWAGAVFVFQATINDAVFGRDPGLGDAFFCPLPNGYSLLMIDTTDSGFVYNPKTQPAGIVTSQDDAVADVTELQLAGRTMLGMTGDQQYFLLDTKLGRVRYFESAQDLDVAARSLGIGRNLASVSDVYFARRLTWFDFAALALLLLPPGVAGVWGLAWILRLRRQAR